MLQLSYTMVNVSDMTQSLESYRDKLGLTSGVKLGTASDAATETEPVAGTCFIAFNVESVDEAYEALTAKGVTFLSKPETKEQEGIRSTNCVDPDGLLITISQPLR